LIDQFALSDYLDQRASDLPLGIRQRLSLAVAIVHEPEILILDEPTSGVDPLARDQFWELLVDLSRNKGVTIFVSTHFMNEAERRDRISLMDSGRVLATQTPANLIKSRGVETLEDTFIDYLEHAARSSRVDSPNQSPATAIAIRVPHPGNRAFSLQRLFAYTIRETLELTRDPSALRFTYFLPVLLGFSSPRSRVPWRSSVYCTCWCICP
jgi:ribosome-dependent ATPase